MKSVIDAVNKYKAEWNNGKNYIYAGTCHNAINSDSFQLTYEAIDNRKWDFVCDESEFNKCVEEMTSMNIKPVYTPTTEDTKELIKKLSFAFNNITAMSEYEDCYDTASDMLDAIKAYNTPPKTDEEKALDDLMLTYWDDSNERLTPHSPIVTKILSSIKAGKIHGVTWSKS